LGNSSLNNQKHRHIEIHTFKHNIIVEHYLNKCSKKGAKLEEAGQYSAAADMYYQSILKNPRNTDALIGMNRTGNKVMNEYLREFSKYAMAEDYKRATYAYLDAVAYQEKIKKVNVDLKIPPSSEDKYEEVRDEYIRLQYEEGLKNIALEEFNKAEKNFNEVYKFNQNYRDVAELRNIAYLEPFYRKAEKLKDEKQYREAYNIYDKILSRVGDYKETRSHREYVLKKGQIPIAISSIKTGRYASYAMAVKQYVLNGIIAIKDPFIKIVDRDDIDKVLQEQRLALSGMVKSEDQVEVGEIAGAKYAVIIDVPTFGVEETPLRKKRYQGFEQYQEKYKNAETGKYAYRTKYRKTYYYIYSAYRKVSMSISYKIISLSTGEVLGTDIVSRSSESTVHYATYTGKKTYLYPSNDGHVNTSRYDYRKLQQLFKGNRTLASRETLINNIYQRSGSEIANKIVNRFK